MLYQLANGHNHLGALLCIILLLDCGNECGNEFIVNHVAVHELLFEGEQFRDEVLVEGVKMLRFFRDEPGQDAFLDLFLETHTPNFYKRRYVAGVAAQNRL